MVKIWYRHLLTHFDWPFRYFNREPTVACFTCSRCYRLFTEACRPSGIGRGGQSWRTVKSGPRGDTVQAPPPDRRNGFAQRLFTPLPARYDRLAEWLSFGQNGRWRRAMVDRLTASQPPPRVVADIAAGTAGVSLQIASRTGARVAGIDLTEQMLRQGARNVAAAGAGDHVSLLNGRAERLPLADASVDALT